nr:hypothetical protein [Leifsonia sp. ZF2019]
MVSVPCRSARTTVEDEGEDHAGFIEALHGVGDVLEPLQRVELTEIGTDSTVGGGVVWPPGERWEHDLDRSVAANCTVDLPIHRTAGMLRVLGGAFAEERIVQYVHDALSRRREV